MSTFEDREAVAQIASVAAARGIGVAVAESLTAGAIASALGAGTDASRWFLGGAVTYVDTTKFRVLGVAPGPVVTAGCAQQMVRGVAELFGADAAVAVTGVGGPGSLEGKPAGTVFIATLRGAMVTVREYRFQGEPEHIMECTLSAALDQLVDQMTCTENPVIGSSTGHARERPAGLSSEEGTQFTTRS